MKEHKLNIDNLFLLWEEDNMKHEYLENWMKNNKDLLFDFENEKIYTGMNIFFKDITVFNDLEKQELLDKGYSNDEINLRFNSRYKKQIVIFEGLFSNILTENRGGLYIEMILKIKDQFYKERSDYLDNKIDLLFGVGPIEKQSKPIKKIAEKWNALLYLLELKTKDLKLPINSEGAFIKSEIQEIGKNRTGSTGQSFYRQILKITGILKNDKALSRSFGKDWKKEVIKLSNNNKSIIHHLDKNY
jgi:hypothetical protein